MKYTTVCESGWVQQGVWNRDTPRYGIRGDKTSLVTLSYERVTWKIWVKMQVLLIYHEN